MCSAGTANTQWLNIVKSSCLGKEHVGYFQEPGLAPMTAREADKCGLPVRPRRTGVCDERSIIPAVLFCFLKTHLKIRK